MHLYDADLHFQVTYMYMTDTNYTTAYAVVEDTRTLILLILKSYLIYFQMNVCNYFISICMCVINLFPYACV